MRSNRAAREALSSSEIALFDETASWPRRAVSTSREFQHPVKPGGARAPGQHRRPSAHREQLADPQLGRAPADFLVGGFAVRAQFGHVAQHGDAAPAARQIVQRLQRRRIESALAL